MSAPDFYLANHGSICMLTPLTLRATFWIDDHIDPTAMRMGSSIAIESRFVQNIVEGIRSDGLTIQ